MKKQEKFKVGDKIIELGQVFRVFKISKIKNGDGNLETVMFFKSHYASKYISKLICSIPLKNIEENDIRKPISLREFKSLLGMLKKKRRLQDSVDLDNLKELLKLNSPADTIEVLCNLCEERKMKPESFTKSKKDVYGLAITRLIQEFALVSQISLEKAEEKINLALQD